MQWYSAAQVAKIWGSVTATVISRIDDGTLGAINIGRADGKRRRWRISEKHLADFEAAQENPKPAAKESKSSSRRTITKPTKDFFATTGGGK